MRTTYVGLWNHAYVAFVRLSKAINSEVWKVLEQQSKTAHMDTYQAVDNLIKFGMQGGATFRLKTATKNLFYSYLRD